MIIILQETSVCFVCAFVFIVIDVRGCCRSVYAAVRVCILRDLQLYFSPFAKRAVQLMV